MCFPRYEACIPLLRKSSHEFVFGFLNPGWNVLRGAGITGQDSQYTTNRQGFHAANKLHERPRTETAPCVNLFINSDISSFWHCNQLLSGYPQGVSTGQ